MKKRLYFLIVITLFACNTIEKTNIDSKKITNENKTSKIETSNFFYILNCQDDILIKGEQYYLIVKDTTYIETMGVRIKNASIYKTSKDTYKIKTGKDSICIINFFIKENEKEVILASKTYKVIKK